MQAKGQLITIDFDKSKHLRTTKCSYAGSISSKFLRHYRLRYIFEELFHFSSRMNMQHIHEFLLHKWPHQRQYFINKRNCIDVMNSTQTYRHSFLRTNNLSTKKYAKNRNILIYILEDKTGIFL